MKNVLLLGSELGKGGAERSISLLSYYLEQIGYNVTLCILSGKGRDSYYKTCSKIVFVDPPAHNNPVQKINAWRYRIKKIKQLKKENNIDVSISFLEGPDYVNVLTKGKEKVVLSIRGSKEFDGQISGTMGLIRKRVLIPFLYKRADKIVCVTQALVNELHKHFNIPEEKQAVIYNFYENEEIKKKALEPLSEEEQKIFSKMVIINSGRLQMQKEHDKMITVLSKIKEKEDVRLMILGDGDRLNELLELAGNLGLKAIVWEGKYEDADVYFMKYQNNAFKLIHHSTVFALPSSWEGFPNVLAEALICEKKVVTTDCPTGPREILNVPVPTEEPLTEPVRTKVGTLAPMLLNLTDKVIETWANEVIHWLHEPQPASEDFEQLMKRFTLDTLLTEWQKIINN